MSAKYLLHSEVVEALQADGWTITHDPFHMTFGGRDVFVDLGAERNTLAAEKGDRRIAVEIQSFLGKSPVRAMQEAIGQYEVYRRIMQTEAPDRVLFMAVEREIYEGIFSERFGQFFVADMRLHLIVFDKPQQRILQWIE